MCKNELTFSNEQDNENIKTILNSFDYDLLNIN